MKAIMVMFDSLNRHMLPPYGCDWVHAPNFQRLAEKSVTFDCSYVGSMPCMPARRELHTGRYNFLHCGWGPLEPFDDSMPEILRENGIYSHLISDHYHYWEDGGATYHNRYSSWEISRGQEGDPWVGNLNQRKGPDPNPHMTATGKPHAFSDRVNREFMQDEANQPQPKTFAMGLDFLERNHGCDNWFLQLETFDPHEPYFVPERFKELYDFDFSKFQNDWPTYSPAGEEQRELTEHYRFLNAALISMCDHYLGKVIDMMDKHDMWKDTMLILNTDHGFLLGEHEWWGKCRMPFYDEVARTPLFIWDPRSGIKNERRQSLVQTIDLPATILEYFGLDLPPDIQGVPLKNTIENNTKVRDAGLFGCHGAQVNVTDGRYVYMRGTDTGERVLNSYTLMPCHMKKRFDPEELRNAALAEPFEFTKGCPVLKIPDAHGLWSKNQQLPEYSTLLFDTKTDPGEEDPLDEPEVEARMLKLLVKTMKANDAPREEFIRLGITDTE